MNKRFKSLQGLRLGQAIYVVIAQGCTESNETGIADRLFYIEDDELLDLIKKLCEERK
jgi:hypothetical protein